MNCSYWIVKLVWKQKWIKYVFAHLIWSFYGEVPLKEFITTELNRDHHLRSNSVITFWYIFAYFVGKEHHKLIALTKMWLFREMRPFL